MSTHYVCGCTSEDCRLNGCLMKRQTTHPAITHCDNCGCDWLDNGLNPIGCPYCKRRGPLSDERIRLIWKETKARMGCGGDPVLWLARAIERAHGISAPQPAEPVKVNAIFETDNREVIGTTEAKVKRVEWQDDGSLTVVIDYWPQ